MRCYARPCAVREFSLLAVVAIRSPDLMLSVDRDARRPGRLHSLLPPWPVGASGVEAAGSSRMYQHL